MWELDQESGGGDATALKRHLFDAYDGFADKRIKNLAKSNRFIVDDRGPNDVGADKNLYPWFCLMFVEVTGPTTIELRMHGGVPFSDEIAAWLDEGNGTTEPNGSMKLPVTVGEQDRLRHLARLVKHIVAPGQRYPVSAYKYVCPRVAKSLEHLADVVASAPRA